MESLKFELLVNIMSYFSLKERIKFLRVSRIFGHAVESTFKSITHLALEEIEIDDYYFCELFGHGSFVQCGLKYSNNLINFLALNCPNLQVLYAPDSQIKFEELQPLGKSLKFFYCKELLINSDHDQLEQIMKKFTELEAYYCCRDSFKSETNYSKIVLKSEGLAYYSLEHNLNPRVSDILSAFLFHKLVREKAITHVMQPFDVLFEKVAKMNNSVPIKSIQFRGERKTMPDIFIPKDVATNLRFLHIKSSAIILATPLSNLEYLYLSGCEITWFELEKRFVSNLISDVLFSSSKLKVISCQNIHFPSNFTKQLLSNLHFYEQLECFKFNSNGHCLDSFENFKVSLPPSIEHFSCTLSVGCLELMDSNCPNLIYLKCDRLSSLSGQFPRLEQLIISFEEQLGRKKMERMYLSLSSCRNLKYLRLVSYKVEPSIKLFLDRVKRLENLDTVEVYMPDSDEEEDFSSSKPIYLKKMIQV